jgi:hypothetical protein
MTPPIHVLALGSLAASGLIAPAAGRRKSVAFSTGLLSILQVGLHTFFTLTMPSGAMAHMPMDAAHTMPMPPPGLGALIPTVPMLCGHILAAACAAWILRSAERAVSRICPLAGPRLTGAVRALMRTLLCRTRRGCCCSGAMAWLLCCPPGWHAPDRASWTSVPLTHAVTRRGPPAEVAAHA